MINIWPSRYSHSGAAFVCSKTYKGVIVTGIIQF